MTQALSTNDHYEIAVAQLARVVMCQRWCIPEDRVEISWEALDPSDRRICLNTARALIEYPGLRELLEVPVPEQTAELVHLLQRHVDERPAELTAWRKLMRDSRAAIARHSTATREARSG